MPINWKSITVPPGLVIIAYLLTWSPPFRKIAWGGLFFAAVALSSYHYGLPSGIFAFVLSLIIMEAFLHSWLHIHTPMAYFSFSLACVVNMWILRNLRRSTSIINRLRSEKTSDVGDRIKRSIHKLNDSFSAIVALAQVNMDDRPESSKMIDINALRVTECVVEIRLEAERLIIG